MEGNVEFAAEERRCFLQTPINTVDDFQPLLTRDDLMRLDSREPCWKRARLSLFIIFWIVWLGLLATAVLIIVFTPRCPPRPNLEFWQSKVGYWIDPFAFKDSGNDMIGDIRGLMESLSYIKEVGAGYILLGSFVYGHYTNSRSELGLTENFTVVDPALGNMDDFRSMVRLFHKNGVEVVVTLDFNSVSVDHPWIEDNSLLKTSMPQKLIARDGRDAIYSSENGTYYSVMSKNTVDLNLESTAVVQRLLEIVKFWLAEGVDGILLSNAAFYVEDGQRQRNLELTKPEENKWFEKYPSSQLFTNGSSNFIRSIRQIIDEVSQLTTRRRLLAVDAGDCGYGLSNNPDPSLIFLGTQENPAAHMVVSKQFVKNRGWKVVPSDKSWMEGNVKSYSEMYQKEKPSLCLTTSTPSDQRHGNILSLAATFLLPGSPVIYYGSELASVYEPHLNTPKNVYPLGKTAFPNLSEMDSTLTCHLPMPWSRSGSEFSTAINNATFSEYLDSFSVAETVESASSAGRGVTSLQLVKKLATLRKAPSILWGQFHWFNSPFFVETKGIEIFIRKAERFNTIIVALLSASANSGYVQDLSSVCDHVTPRLVYPPKMGLSEGDQIKSKSVYLRSDNSPSVYVFECT